MYALCLSLRSLESLIHQCGGSSWASNPYLLAEPERVNESRARVGLPPLEDYN